MSLTRCILSGSPGRPVAGSARGWSRLATAMAPSSAGCSRWVVGPSAPAGGQHPDHARLLVPAAGAGSAPAGDGRGSRRAVRRGARRLGGAIEATVPQQRVPASASTRSTWLARSRSAWSHSSPPARWPPILGAGAVLGFGADRRTIGAFPILSAAAALTTPGQHLVVQPRPEAGWRCVAKKRKEEGQEREK